MSEPKPAWHVPLYGSDGFVEAVQAAPIADAEIAQAARDAYAEIDQVLRLWPYPALSMTRLEALRRALIGVVLNSEQEA